VNQRSAITLLSVNVWQLAGTRCQQDAAGPGEFTKVVYESTFTKYAEETSFINAYPLQKRLE
jgi:hypothetical protein